MARVGTLFLLGALGALGGALLVRRVGYFVLHFAAEFGDAGWGGGVPGREVGGLGRVVVVGVVVAAFGGDVGLGGDAEGSGYFLALGGGESVEVGGVVVGVGPDGAGGGGGRVDEELVVGLRVVLAGPAGGEGAAFVFHAAAGEGRDAIAGFVGG